jgi:hypothetical protein
MRPLDRNSNATRCLRVESRSSPPASRKVIERGHLVGDEAAGSTRRAEFRHDATAAGRHEPANTSGARPRVCGSLPQARRTCRESRPARACPRRSQEASVAIWMQNSRRERVADPDSGTDPAFAPRRAAPRRAAFRCHAGDAPELRGKQVSGFRWTSTPPLQPFGQRRFCSCLRPWASRSGSVDAVPARDRCGGHGQWRAGVLARAVVGQARQRSPRGHATLARCALDAGTLSPDGVWAGV